MAPPNRLLASSTHRLKSEVCFIITLPSYFQSYNAFLSSDIVDKTASFVARNGFEFEARIRRNEQNNPKFNFLNPGDPYHAYYQSKVQDLKEGKPTEAPSAPPPPGRAPPPAPTTVPASVATQLKQQEILKQMQSETIQIPKEPPPDFEFTVEPPSISAMELYVI